MSRRINCTLTDRQFDLLVAAVASYDLALEEFIDDGVEPPQAMGASKRMWDKIMEAGR